MTQITPNIENVEYINIEDKPRFPTYFDVAEPDCWYAWVKFKDREHPVAAVNPNRQPWDQNNPDEIVQEAITNIRNKEAWDKRSIF